MGASFLARSVREKWGFCLCGADAACPERSRRLRPAILREAKGRMRRFNLLRVYKAKALARSKGLLVLLTSQIKPPTSRTAPAADRTSSCTPSNKS